MAVDWAMALGVERTFASLNQFRRLRVRYEKLADIHEAFLALASALLLLEPLKVWKNHHIQGIGL